MGFSYERVENLKAIISGSIRRGEKKPFDYMLKYKEAVVAEDYEMCQAITDVLKPLNYDTADTHPHIPQLNK